MKLYILLFTLLYNNNIYYILFMSLKIKIYIINN